MRLAGKSFVAIGQELGITRQCAWKLVNRELGRRAQELKASGERVRQHAVERLEAVLADLWPLCTATRAEDGTVIEGPRLEAIDRLLKLEQRRAALLGLDTPVQTRLAGPDGGPVAVLAAYASVLDRAYGEQPALPSGITSDPPALPSPAIIDIEACDMPDVVATMGAAKDDDSVIQEPA